MVPVMINRTAEGDNREGPEFMVNVGCRPPVGVIYVVFVVVDL